MSLGLYLHIPYCFSKCRYCDFYSHPGERGVPEAYVDALVRELDRFAPEAPLQPDTLYFGGGTPSLLRPEQAKRLIDAARPMPGGRDHTGSKPGDGDGRKPCRLPGGGREPHLLFRGCSLPGIPSCAHWADRTRQSRRGLPLPPRSAQALRTSAATSCWHCRTTPRPNLTKRWN